MYIGEHDLAKHHAERAATLNPNSAFALYYLGSIIGYGGDPATGIEIIETIERLDPFFCESPAFLEMYGDLLYMARRYEDAIVRFRLIADQIFYIDQEIAFCYAQLGRKNEVKTYVERFERNRPQQWDNVLHYASHMRIVKQDADRAHWTEGYRKAGFDV